MLLDGELLFMNKEAVTTTTAKVIDGGFGGNAVGNELFLRVLCTETAAAAGEATVQVQFRTSDTVTGSGATAKLDNPKVLMTVGPFSKAEIVSGAMLAEVRQPYGTKRYFDVNFVISSGPLTAGKFTIFLSSEK